MINSVDFAKDLQSLSQISWHLDTNNRRLLRMLRVLHDGPQLDQLGLASARHIHV